MSEAFHLGRLIVKFHDQEGFTYDLSLEMLREAQRPVGLVGILHEAAARNWPARLVCEVASQWSRLFQPTQGEQAALLALGVVTPPAGLKKYPVQSATTSCNVATPSATSR